MGTFGCATNNVCADFPDFEQIEDFLINILDRDLFHIYSIDSRAKGKNNRSCPTIITDNTGALRDWITRQQEKKHGIYFAVNYPDPALKKRAKTGDYKWLEAAHVDCDPPGNPGPGFDLAEWQDAKVEELLSSELVRRPTVIWISGYGVQALWLLDKPLKATKAAKDTLEDINRRLATHFGGDSAHDVPRILRLPGTTNYPSAKKAREGRKESRARLVFDRDATFTFEDFDRLPAPPRKAKASSNPRRIDYTKYDYDEHYTPISFEELERTRPDIITANEANTSSDRSDVAYGFIRSVATHLLDQLGVSSNDLADDINVKRNLAELVLNCELPFVTHYDDQPNPRGKIGLDIGKVLRDMQDDGVSYNERREARAVRKADDTKLAAKPTETLEPQEARRLFIRYVKDHVHEHDLPNEGTAGRVPATEANVRQILLNARVVARWDIMKDEPRFIAMPSGNHREKPELYFQQALRRTGATGRAAAELSLVTDAIAELGLTQREEVRKLLEAFSRENMYHPMEDYCTATPWDGCRRIRALAGHLTTPHPLAGRYLEIFFRQGVAAVMSMRKWMATGRGEMLRSILVLDGKQLIGKTGFLRDLIPAGFESKGSKLSLGNTGERDSMAETLSGTVALLDELQSSLMRSEHAAFKNFIAATTDSYRLPYARTWVEKPRMTHFCGTSNALQLFDVTGSSRFIVLPVTKIRPLEMTPEELQQCYAEAWYDVVDDGQTWWLTEKEAVISAEWNGDHTAETEEMLAVTAYFNAVGSRHRDEWVSARHVAQLLGLRISPQRWHIVRDALVAAGCEYREDVTWKGKRIRRVWSFPVLPERLASLEAGGL